MRVDARDLTGGENLSQKGLSSRDESDGRRGGVVWSRMEGLENVLDVAAENWMVIGITLGAMALVSYLLQMFSLARNVPPALSKAEFTAFPLIHVQDISHNTKLFRFGLKHPQQSLELPIGKHISVLGYDEDGEEVRRPYTPTTLADTRGHFDLVVKIYPQGKMSQVFARLALGQTLQFRGPMGRFKYVPNMKSFFGMVAGGTGITPMYQVMKAILENPEDKTKVSLIFGNITEDDILLKEDLDAMQRTHPDRVEIFYILDKPPQGWTGGKGYVTPEMITERFGSPSADRMVLSCGPPPMKKALKGYLENLGFGDDSLFEF